MRKQKWIVIERMHQRFLDVVDAALTEGEGDKNEDDDEGEEEEADAEAAIALAYPLLMRGLGYALELLGKPERRSFRRLKGQLAQIAPPLSRDYTNLFDQVRNYSKKVTYFEDDFEVLESLEEIADGIKEFIAELRAMAIAAGDAIA